MGNYGKMYVQKSLMNGGLTVENHLWIGNCQLPCLITRWYIMKRLDLRQANVGIVIGYRTLLQYNFCHMVSKNITWPYHSVIAFNPRTLYPRYHQIITLNILKISGNVCGIMENDRKCQCLIGKPSRNGEIMFPCHVFLPKGNPYMSSCCWFVISHYLTITSPFSSMVFHQIPLYPL